MRVLKGGDEGAAIDWLKYSFEKSSYAFSNFLHCTEFYFDPFMMYQYFKCAKLQDSFAHKYYICFEKNE